MKSNRPSPFVFEHGPFVSVYVSKTGSDTYQCSGMRFVEKSDDKIHAVVNHCQIQGQMKQLSIYNQVGAQLTHFNAHVDWPQETLP